MLNVVVDKTIIVISYIAKKKSYIINLLVDLFLITILIASAQSLQKLCEIFDC